MAFVEKMFSSLLSCLNHYDQVGENEDLFQWEIFKLGGIKKYLQLFCIISKGTHSLLQRL